MSFAPGKAAREPFPRSGLKYSKIHVVGVAGNVASFQLGCNRNAPPTGTAAREGRAPALPLTGKAAFLYPRASAADRSPPCASSCARRAPPASGCQSSAPAARRGRPSTAAIRHPRRCTTTATATRRSSRAITTPPRTKAVVLPTPATRSITFLGLAAYGSVFALHFFRPCREPLREPPDNM